MKIEDYVSYCEDVPSCLISKVKRGKIKVGQMLGSKDGGGYFQFKIGNKRFSAHRVVWELHYGTIPDGMMIDHIDRDVNNTKISNLRLATNSENSFNSDVLENTKTGHRGLRYIPDKNLWRVKLTANGNKIDQYFKDKDEALKAISKFKEEHHGKFKV